MIKVGSLVCSISASELCDVEVSVEEVLSMVSHFFSNILSITSFVFKVLGPYLGLAGFNTNFGLKLSNLTSAGRLTIGFSAKALGL